MISLVLTATLLVTAAGSNLVLCIGPDGHVSLELRGPAGQCAPAGIPDHADCDDTTHDACATSSDPSCEQCVDIPVPEINLGDCIVKTARLSPSKKHVAAAPAAIAQANCCSRSVAVPLSAASRDAPAPQPVPLVVLRI